MKFLTICLTATLSLSVFADTSVERDLSQDLDVYGQESKFEILKNGYESARQVPSPEDFEVFDADESRRTMKCVLASAAKPEELDTTVVARFSVKIPATPGNGPLFPGRPEGLETKVLVGVSGVFNAKFSSIFINEKTNTDFVVRVPENALGLYNDLGGNVAIYIRMEKDYLPFKIAKLSVSNGPQFPTKETVLYYGYCFKK